MLVLEKAIAAQTTYTASVYQADGFTGVALNISATESGAGRYTADVLVNTPASPPSAPYLVIWRNGTTEVARCQYAWDGTQEITASTLSPKITTLFSLVNAGGTAYTAAALANAPAGGGTSLFDQPTKDYLLAIPQAPLLAENYTVPNNNAIAQTATDTATLVARITSARATNLDTPIPTPLTIWAAATRSLTDKAGFALSAAGDSSIAAAVWGAATRTLSSLGSVVADIWANPTRSLTGTVTTDADSRTASQTDLTPVLNAIGQLPAPNNTGIIEAKAAAIAANATLTTIAPKISTLFGLVETVGDRFKATALVNAPSSSGGLTQPQIDQLNRIDSNSAIARKAVTNSAMVDLIASTTTILDDDEMTPVFKIRMLNAAGQPNVNEVVSREVVPV